MHGMVSSRRRAAVIRSARLQRPNLIIHSNFAILALYGVMLAATSATWALNVVKVHVEQGALRVRSAPFSCRCRRPALTAPSIQAGATPLGAENAVRVLRAHSLPSKGITFVIDNRLDPHGDVNVTAANTTGTVSNSVAGTSEKTSAGRVAARIDVSGRHGRGRAATRCVTPPRATVSFWRCCSRAVRRA